MKPTIIASTARPLPRTLRTKMLIGRLLHIKHWRHDWTPFDTNGNLRELPGFYRLGALEE